MNRSFLYITAAIALFAIGYFISSVGDEEMVSIKRSRILMGTVIEIEVKENDKSLGELAIKDAFNEIERIENIFTTYKENSNIQWINQSRDTLISVNSEIYDLMMLSDSLWKISYGAFDISLNNLIKTWDFESINPTMPTKEQIEDALRQSGWRNIKLLNNNRFLRKAEVGLNLGAIAKGYAVDRAIEVVKEQGIKNVLINAGGEIKSLGSDWIIGIRDPRNAEQIVESVNLGEMAIATSGDYEIFFEINGKRYHHILKPSTGYPADSLISVSVLNPSSTMADALATAVFVLGPVRGLEFIENIPNTEVLLIDKNNRKIFSEGFVKYMN